MPYSVATTLFACTSCCICQKVKFVKTSGTAQLCAQVDGQQTWLIAFTDTIEVLPEGVNLNMDSSLDDIREGLLFLENITLYIDN